MNFDSYFTPRTKINLRWIIDLNVSAKTVKLLEENTGINLYDLGLGSGFLDIILKIKATEEKTGKIGPHQNLKLLCFKGNQETVNKKVKG